MKKNLIFLLLCLLCISCNNGTPNEYRCIYTLEMHYSNGDATVETYERMCGSKFNVYGSKNGGYLDSREPGDFFNGYNALLINNVTRIIILKEERK